MCILHDDTKQRFDHHDAVNRIENSLKALRHTIPAYKIVVKHSIECESVCDVTSIVAKDIVLEMTDNAAANIVKLFK